MKRRVLLLTPTLGSTVNSLHGVAGKVFETSRRFCVYRSFGQGRLHLWRRRLKPSAHFLRFVITLKDSGYMDSSLEFSSSLGSVSSLLTRCRTFKVLVIGDSGVGKTCLTHRLCAGEFPCRSEATIGVDFRERVLEIDGEKIKVTGDYHPPLKS